MIDSLPGSLLDAVHAAGRRLLATWPGSPDARITLGITSETKRDGTVVTEADRASEQILITAITTAIPEAVIISEEDEASHERSGTVVWFVDPLDGTRQYLNGSPDFAILLSAWSHGQPVFSAALFPADGILATAHGTKTTFLPDAPAPPPQEIIHSVYCDPPGLGHYLPHSAEHIVDQYESTRVLIDVARGQAAGAIVLMCGHQAWDVAAPIHLIQASGGLVTDERGQAVALNDRHVRAGYLIAARDTAMHRLLLDALAPALASPEIPHPREETLMTTEPFLTPVPDDWAARFFDDGFEPTFRRLGKYDSTHDDLDNLIRLLRLEPPAHILDVPCGFGRHAGPLAERGFTVTGIDMSPDQIDHARRTWPTASFEVRDMRNPPEGPFDAVFNLWSSFGFLESRDEDVHALASWRSALAPGGILVMELTTLERAQFENRTGNEAVSTKRVEHNGVVEEAWYDWTAQYSNVRYSRPGWSRECRTRMYSREQLTDALTEAGFRDVRMAGDFGGGPVQSANRTIVIAAAAPDKPEREAS